VTDPQSGPLAVLVVDDEQPALDELAYLLARDDRVGDIRTCASAREALKILGDGYGLMVETAPGAGTKVTVRVPKYAPGVHP
jgi:two-component system LytT family sensor kinase